MKGRPNKIKLTKIIIYTNNSILVFDTSSKENLKKSIAMNKHLISFDLRENETQNDNKNQNGQIFMQEQKIIPIQIINNEFQNAESDYQINDLNNNLFLNEANNNENIFFDDDNFFNLNEIDIFQNNSQF